MNKYFYLPSVLPIFVDLLLITLSIVLTLSLAPLSTDIPFRKYSDVNLIFCTIWILISFLTQRYVSFKTDSYASASKKLLKTTVLVSIVIGVLFFTPLNRDHSVWVLISYSLLIFLFSTLYFILAHAFGNATEYLEPHLQEQAEQALTDHSAESKPQNVAEKTLYDTVVDLVGIEIATFITPYIDLSSPKTLINFTFNFLDLQSKPSHQYQAAIVLKSLNQIRGINKMLSLHNLKLPLEANIAFYFEQNSLRKERIYQKYPVILRSLVYFFDYIFRRVLPKLSITNELYFALTGGKNRVLSQTEVLGRVIYCGYEIEKIQTFGRYTWVVARKKKVVPGVLDSKRYGPFIKLRRVGRNGKIIYVLKLRTMYPYSEYLQAYIYQLNNLQEGGKFKNDSRLNTLGKFMRKYWLDELPMLFNWLRGDMKLVGVRPLSQHYFSLYSPDLQRKRIRYKPGLLPPFYADMPTTLTEIEVSEMNYLLSCEQKGVWKTDILYFFKILRNILFRKARSA